MGTLVNLHYHLGVIRANCNTTQNMFENWLRKLSLRKNNFFIGLRHLFLCLFCLHRFDFLAAPILRKYVKESFEINVRLG